MSSDGGGSEGDAKVDIDGLLEGALREMKLSEQQKHQQQQGHGKEQGRVQEQRGSSVAVSASAPIHDAHLQSMIEEFNSAATGNVGQEELPEKIDAALAKLLSITDDSTLTGLAEDADLTQVDQMIEQMMSELTSKELLAEPFADMARAYPLWIAANRSRIDPLLLRDTYEKQCVIVSRIDSLFRDPKFDENKEAQQKEIFDLMQQMQELGSPPEDMLKEIGMPSTQTTTPPDCVQM